MALSRELTRRLHTDDEPLSKRLKLAENTFTSEALAVTRKEDLVLKWLCQLAEKEKKNDKFVWSTLSRCLRFTNTSGNVILKSSVKHVLIDTLAEKLADFESCELDDVLDCCEIIFASREMRRYFQSNIASFCELMNKLASIDDPPARGCIVSGIECFVNCYKQSVNKDELAHVFLGEILYPLCSLVDKSRSDRLGAETHKCIQAVIFGKSKLTQFKEYNGGDENDFAARIFAELKKKAETAKEDIVVVASLCIFRAAIGSYKNDPATIDSIFRCLIESACGAKIKVFACIRQQLTSVTLDYQNEIRDLKLFEYLRRLIDEIISSEIQNSVRYDALGTVAALNPLIVETKMQDILRCILLEKKVSESDIDSYRDLMIVLIDAGVRLRREVKIIFLILKTIEEKLMENVNEDIQVDQVLPEDFKKQFSKTVCNMTSMQTISVFRTLIFHLNNCVESSVEDSNTATFMIQANVDLLSAYFDGVRIFDNSVPASGQNKFIQALRDFGKTISSLTDKVLKIKNNEKMISALLTAAWYWDNMHSWMRYYVPDVVPEKLDFPISEAQINDIVANIVNADCKYAMNKILVRQMGRNLKDEISLDLSNLLDGFENYWSIIIDQDPQILSSLSNSQIAELANFLLNDARSSSVDSVKSMKRLSADRIQNDERFVKALVYQTLVDIATRINESTTKTITGHVNVTKILNREKVSKLMRAIKKDLMRKEWISLSEESISVLEKDLKILLRLPLKNLSLDLRTLLLLVAYSIKKECEHNETIIQLCTDITLDASEKSDIDIIDLIDPDSLIDELTHDKSVRRAIESSLRNVSSWKTLEILIKKSKTSVDSATIFLECIERVKPKLKNEEREIFRKAEQKLGKKLLAVADEELKDGKDIKRLTLALKVSMTNGKIPDNLIDITKSALHRIFVCEASKDEKLMTEGLQLVGVILKHRGKLELDEEIINNIWPHVLNNPIREIAQPLLERTEPKALSKLLTLLHAKTIRALAESNESCFTSALISWDSITSVQMGGARHKLRTAALYNLLQILQISKIPMELWPSVLKFVRSTLPEALHVAERGIDVVTLIAGRSLKEAELSVCDEVIAICSSCVKSNAGIITDRLPILLDLYRKIVRLVVRESRMDNDSSRQRKLGCLALDIEKLSNALVKLKKDLARMSPYVIADLVEIFSEGSIPSRVKGPLEDSVGHFLSISDQHAISLLSRTLPIATREIFKTLYETYNKFYKFTGKI